MSLTKSINPFYSIASQPGKSTIVSDKWTKLAPKNQSNPADKAYYEASRNRLFHVVNTLDLAIDSYRNHARKKITDQLNELPLTEPARKKLDALQQDVSHTKHSAEQFAQTARSLIDTDIVEQSVADKLNNSINTYVNSATYQVEQLQSVKTAIHTPSLEETPRPQHVAVPRP